MTPEQSNSESREGLRQNLRERLRESAGSGAAASPPRSASRSTPPAGGKGEDAGRSILFARFDLGTPGLAQMAAFCRQLATLISVGIPLVQCLRTLSQRIEHTKLKQTVTDITRLVEEGKSFSQALAAHPEVFSNLVVNVVRVGEEGGILEESLQQLAELMERRYELRRRVTSAIAYPVLAISFCGLLLMVILGFALPVFKQVYGDMELPAVTRFVLGLSDIVRMFWWLIIAVVVGGVFGIRAMIKSSVDFARVWDGLVLRMPVVRTVAVKANVTRTARTMANLLRAGVPVLESLRISAETSENLVVADMLDATRDNLEKGGRLEKPLRDAGIFPALVVDMVAIGDEAGRLDLMFDKIAETYDADVEHHIRMLNTILEPALILTIGAVVLVLALAVLQPYWQLGSVFQQ